MKYLSLYKTLFAGSLLTLFSDFAQATNTAQIEINAVVTAACSIDAPAMLDMGTIPMAALVNKEIREELDDYAKTFTINTTCSGTSRYSLAFAPSRNTHHLLFSDAGLMGFAFYNPDNVRMDFSAPVALTRNASQESLTIKVVPAKTSERVGEDSASVTLTISPL